METYEVALAASYLALGLHGHKKYNEVLPIWSANGGEGHLGMIDGISKYAPIIADALESEDRDFPGVFHYEVTEPFGEWLAEQVLETGSLPSSTDGLKKLEEMTEAFFTQGQMPKFDSYEIRPVVAKPHGEVVMCETFEEAKDHATEADQVVFGLYGKRNDGFCQKITDRADKKSMIHLVGSLFGIRLGWSHQNKYTFSM